MGKFHTNNPTAKYAKPLLTVTYKEIQALVDKPQAIDKTHAQWLIPSTYESRDKPTQENSGLYGLLWLDIDDNPPTLSTLRDVLIKAIGTACNYEIYTSKSATKDCQKARVLVPLARMVNYSTWHALQVYFNDYLEQNGIAPDRANEAANQLCYLPNKGAFYDSISERGQGAFNHSSIKDLAVGSGKTPPTTTTATTSNPTAKVAKTTKSLIEAFNQTYTTADILLNNGYEQKGDSFKHSLSENNSFNGSIDPATGRYHALSTKDPLYSSDKAHDAFSAFVMLEHGGDRSAALKAAGDLLKVGSETWNKVQRREYMKAQLPPMNNQEGMNAPVVQEESILDSDEKHSTIDLLKFLDNKSLIKKLSIQTAYACNLPESTAFLNIIGIYSSIACRKWNIQYQTGGSLPIGLYVITEQPSGVGKTRTQKIAQSPFWEIHADIKKNYKEPEGASDEDKKISKNVYGGLFTTNTTPEALDNVLHRTSGFFSCVASEQGLVDSLLGLSYSDGSSNNNDVLLSGFDAGFPSTERIGRIGYTGAVVGGICSFAQQGTVEKVLQVSNGTGISERFLMLCEPHKLGSRNHLMKVQYDKTLHEEYAKKCGFFKSLIKEPVEFKETNSLAIDEVGWQLIGEYRNSIEPELADGGRFSHISIRGAAAKIDMQIMKIAANLHLLERTDDYSPTIPNTIVTTAINIANALLEANLALCQTKGIIGVKAEFKAIIAIYEKANIPKTERQIIQSRSRVEPFSNMTGNRSDIIRSVVNEMVEHGLLGIQHDQDETTKKWVTKYLLIK